MPTRNDFPALDFSKYKTDFNDFAKDVFKAGEEWGFFILTNHGLSNVDRMFELSTQFFDLPKEQKAEKILDATMTGYDGKQITTFASSEGLAFGMPPGRLFNRPNLPAWWDESRLQEIEDFKASCYDFSLKILSCFAVEMGLEKTFFETSHHQHKDPGNALKLIKYQRFDKQPDAPRLSEHTDWGSITLLFTETPGLEIRGPDNQWTSVPTIPGGVVVNVADALSMWTDKKLKSAFHRVTWETVRADQERLSVAYFVLPNNDAVLSEIDTGPNGSKARPLTCSDYYKIRLGLTFGAARENNDAGIAFDEIDQKVLERVKTLQVATYGAPEANKVET